MSYWNKFWQNQARASAGQTGQAQVLRTLHGEPVSESVFSRIIGSVIEHLEPNSNMHLLDLCCGNGVITRALTNDFREIIAVDLACPFIEQLNRLGIANISAQVGDAKTIQFESASFDRILLYAGLQYFSEAEVVTLFSRLYRWLRPGGLVAIGDIPDSSRRWAFFDSPARETAYFDGLQRGVPLIGSWFDGEWLGKAARFAGFKSAEVKSQPNLLPYRHYRFDIVLRT